MAGRDPVEVTVEIDGQETAAGTLWPKSQTDRMAVAYEGEQRRIARALSLDPPTISHRQA
jgi:hypothetical protein